MQQTHWGRRGAEKKIELKTSHLNSNFNVNERVFGKKNHWNVQKV